MVRGLDVGSVSLICNHSSQVISATAGRESSTIDATSGAGIWRDRIQHESRLGHDRFRTWGDYRVQILVIHLTPGQSVSPALSGVSLVRTVAIVTTLRNREFRSWDAQLKLHSPKYSSHVSTKIHKVYLTSR